MNDRAGSAGYQVGETQGYETAVNAVGDGLYRLDAAGRFVSVNDAILQQTGFSRDELVGKHASVVVADEDVATLQREIGKRLSGKGHDTTYTLVIETADGERIPCELRFSLIVEDGTFHGTAGVIRPIEDTERATTALRSLRQTYESLSSVVDQADVGLFVLDANIDVVWINSATERYFDIDREDVVGRDKRELIDGPITDRVDNPDTFAETVCATYEDNTYVEQFECKVTTTDGKTRWLEHRSRPLESGRFAGGRVELYYDVTDRRRLAVAREQSERRFRSLVDAVDEYAIYMLNPDGCIASWNPGAQEIKGFARGDVLGEHVSMLYTTEDREAGIPEENLTRARREGSIKDEGWRIRADGTRFWAHVTITAIRDGGELEGFAKVTRDMTERVERERQLERERDLIERIFETSPVGLAVLERGGDVARINDRMEELLGAETLLAYVTGDRPMLDPEGTAIRPEDQPIKHVFSTGEPVVDREIYFDSTASGSGRWLSVTAAPLRDGEAAEQVLMTATDVTELRKLAEQRRRELAEREKELAGVQLAIELLGQGEGSDNEVLEPFVESLPESFQAPEGTAAKVVVGNQEQTTADYEASQPRLVATEEAATGTTVTLEIVRTDGPDEFIEEERELLEALTTLLALYLERDEYVTQLHAETRRLEEFAYAASHDLKEPLRMVSSYLQLLESRYGDRLDEDGEEFLAFAVDGAERMQEMIDGLLEYSRVESGDQEMAPVDLAAVLDDVQQDLAVSIGEADAEITVEDLPTVRGDGGQLRQVFQNLLENAIAYSGDERPQIHVAAERAGDEWVLAVSDEGIGIDPDQHERVFEVFERLHDRSGHEGTGIGLALVRRIVENHGGEIWLESTPGAGTTISFTLPAVENDP